MKRMLLALILLVLLTGCWDQVEIEDRGFVIGTAIDLGDEKENGNIQITLTNQFVVPSGMGSPTQGGGDQKAYSNLSATGESIYTIEHKMARLASRTPFLEHLKIIVVSDKLARTDHLFSDVLDIFLRNPEIRRSVKVIISDGEAKKILDSKPTIEKLPAMYIESVMENSFKNAGALQPVRLGRVHEYMLDRISYLLPRVFPDKTGINYDGAAVFNGYNNQMVGILDGKEMKGLNLFTGNSQKGAINVEFEEKTVSFEFEEVSSKIKVTPKSPDNISINVDISVEGSIAEMFGAQSVVQDKNLRTIEENISKKVEKLVKKTIKKAQEELKTDFLGIGNKLKQHHYDLWKQISDDWDRGANYFSKSTFHVTAKAEIRATGSANQTKNK